MKDVVLIVVGAVIGIAVKTYVEPLLAKRQRGAVRGEAWLESAMDHSEEVLAHIQSVRSQVTSRLAFDGDAIALEILRSLTSEYGPQPLEAAAENKAAGEDIKQFASKARAAWMVTRVALMDDENQTEAADVLSEPLYAVQGYSTALLNFSSAARRQLSGR